MTDTIEIRRRDMVSSCPVADELKALREKITQQEDTINCYKALNKELIETRAVLRNIKDLILKYEEVPIDADS